MTLFVFKGLRLLAPTSVFILGLELMFPLVEQLLSSLIGVEHLISVTSLFLSASSFSVGCGAIIDFLFDMPLGTDAV